MTRARFDGLAMLPRQCFLHCYRHRNTTDQFPRQDGLPGLYYGARTAAQGGDPYQPEEVTAVYRSETGNLPQGRHDGRRP